MERQIKNPEMIDLSSLVVEMNNTQKGNSWDLWN